MNCTRNDIILRVAPDDILPTKQGFPILGTGR